MTYPISERFISINGEGLRAGEPAVFLRLRGCNLRCAYCDTAYAREAEGAAEEYTAEELAQYCCDAGPWNITVTGGEPLAAEGIRDLLWTLCDVPGRRVEVETNGAVPLRPYRERPHNLSFTMDYKLPSSGMEERMCMANLSHLSDRDALKFVCGDVGDMERARELIEMYSLSDRLHVLFSPVFGKLEPANMIAYLREHGLFRVRLSLQLHKYIWNPQTRGV